MFTRAWANSPFSIDQATIADSCTSFGENILSKCQKKIIGLAPGAKVAANDAAVNQLIEDHIEYLKKSFPASVGAHELYKKFESHDALEEYIQKVSNPDRWSAASGRAASSG